MDQAALVIFDAVGHDQPSKVLDQVCDMLRHRLSIPMTYQQYEVLLAGHSAPALTRPAKRSAPTARSSLRGPSRSFLWGFVPQQAGCGAEVCQGHARPGLLRAALRGGFRFQVAAEAECLVDLFQDCYADDILPPTVAVTGAFQASPWL